MAAAWAAQGGSYSEQGAQFKPPELAVVSCAVITDNMLLQWSHHPAGLVARLAELLAKVRRFSKSNRDFPSLLQGGLLDVKLAAEGKVMRAHKVVLAAASCYFEVD